MISNRIFDYREAIGVLVCTLLLSLALVLEHVFFMPPCNLCMIQRSLLLVLLAIFGIRHMVRARQRSYIVLNTCSIVIILLGIAISLRHLWLQHFAVGESLGCLPSVGYIFANNSVVEAISMLYKGSSDCTKIHFTVLGLSIPAQLLLVYTLLIFFDTQSLKSRVKLFD